LIAKREKELYLFAVASPVEARQTAHKSFCDDQKEIDFTSISKIKDKKQRSCGSLDLLLADAHVTVSAS
jgi:hypothetical protein